MEAAAATAVGAAVTAVATVAVAAGGQAAMPPWTRG